MRAPSGCILSGVRPLRVVYRSEGESADAWSLRVLFVSLGLPLNLDLAIARLRAP